jgi:hypothetical protein
MSIASADYGAAFLWGARGLNCIIKAQRMKLKAESSYGPLSFQFIAFGYNAGP